MPIPEPSPREQLEFEAAALRAGLADGGLRVDVKGSIPFSPGLKTMVGRGLLAVMRPERGRRLATRLHTTPRGIDRLAGIEERHGEGFGPERALGRPLTSDVARR